MGLAGTLALQGLALERICAIRAICGLNCFSQDKLEAGGHTRTRDAAASGVHYGSGGLEAKPVRVEAERG